MRSFPTGPLAPARTQVSRLSHSSTRSTDSTLNIFLRWPQRLPDQPEAAAVQLGFESERSGSRPASGEPSLPSGRSRGADAGRSSALSPAPPSRARGRARAPCAPPAPAAHALLRERRLARAEARAPLRTLAPPRPVGRAPDTRSPGAWARAPAGPCDGGRWRGSPAAWGGSPGAPHCACADAGALASGAAGLVAAREE